MNRAGKLGLPIPFFQRFVAPPDGSQQKKPASKDAGFFLFSGCQFFMAPKKTPS
jgi:hypothetical protein